MKINRPEHSSKRTLAQSHARRMACTHDVQGFAGDSRRVKSARIHKITPNVYVDDRVICFLGVKRRVGVFVENRYFY